MAQSNNIQSLNPCFSGTYSQRLNGMGGIAPLPFVLILVLVEHTLREWYNYVCANEY